MSHLESIAGTGSASQVVKRLWVSQLATLEGTKAAMIRYIGRDIITGR